MNRLKLLFLCVLLYSCNEAQTFTKIVSVYDGDTFTTIDGTVLRLSNVDCPEISQTFGLQAKAMTQMLVEGREVTISNKRLDKYGRTVCDVYCHSIWINEFMVEMGYAWAYKKYSPVFYKLQIAAKHARMGLWQYEAIPPFLFRQQKKFK